MFEDIMLALGPVVKGFRNLVKLLTGNIYEIVCSQWSAKMNGALNLAKNFIALPKAQNNYGTTSKFFAVEKKAVKPESTSQGLNKCDAAKAALRAWLAWR